MRDIDLNLLPVFQALFEERRVTRAAARLNLTQSAVSHALSRLRDSLDDQVFVRSPGGLIPTARAMALAPVVNEALGRLRGALARSAFNPAASDRCFRLAMPGYLSELFVPRLIETAYRQGATSRFDIWHKGIDALDLLDTRMIDVAAGTFNELPSRFNSVTLLQERAVWVARSDHPVAFGLIELQDLMALPRLELTAGVSSPERLEVWAGAGGILPLRPGAPPPAVTLHHSRSAIGVLTCTDLVALLPERAVNQMRSEYPVRALPQFEPQLFTQARLVWTKANEEEPGTTWLRELIMTISQDIAI